MLRAVGFLVLFVIPAGAQTQEPLRLLEWAGQRIEADLLSADCRGRQASVKVGDLNGEGAWLAITHPVCIDIAGQFDLDCRPERAILRVARDGQIDRIYRVPGREPVGCTR